MMPELRRAPGAAISESPSKPTAEGANLDPQPSSGNPQPAGHRIISVDLLRGVTVMAMILANGAAHFEETAPRFLLHSPWVGLTLADFVFPAFVTLVGISIPLALHRTKRAGDFDLRQARHIISRTLRIVLLGVILSNLDWFSDPEENPFRPWGVLQRIGLVYGAGAFLFVWLETRTLAVIAAVILVLYYPLAVLPPLDGGAADLKVRGCNFVASVDRVMLGAGDHLWVTGPDGSDPEGLLSTLPAIAQALIGIVAGHWLIREAGRKVARRLAAFGGAMLVLGLGAHLVFPVIKDLWSSSFVLVTAGLTLLLLAGLHRWLDHEPESHGLGAWVLSVPLAFGRNAIAAYVLHEIADPMLEWPLMQGASEWGQANLGRHAGALLAPLIFLLLIWICMRYLQRHRWIVKI